MHPTTHSRIPTKLRPLSPLQKDTLGASALQVFAVLGMSVLAQVSAKPHIFDSLGLLDAGARPDMASLELD